MGINRGANRLLQPVTPMQSSVIKQVKMLLQEKRYETRVVNTNLICCKIKKKSEKQSTSESKSGKQS